MVIWRVHLFLTCILQGFSVLLGGIVHPHTHTNLAMHITVGMQAIHIITAVAINFSDNDHHMVSERIHVEIHTLCCLVMVQRTVI